MDSKVKKWALNILNDKKYDDVKFIEHTIPSEVNIFNDKVMIILLSKSPLIILIKNKFIADSYMNYFELLWKIAKKRKNNRDD